METNKRNEVKKIKKKIDTMGMIFAKKKKNEIDKANNQSKNDDNKFSGLIKFSLLKVPIDDTLFILNNWMYKYYCTKYLKENKYFLYLNRNFGSFCVVQFV